jgi:capsular exopolysaccharide synthesis family protein
MWPPDAREYSEMNSRLQKSLNLSHRRLETREEIGSEEINFRAILGVLRRQRWSIVLIAMIFGVGSALYALQLPTRYTSTATVMFNARQLNVLNIESVVSDLGTRPEVIESEIGLIRSAAILNRVIDRLDLVADPEFNPVLPRERTGVAGAIAAVSGAVSSTVVEPVVALLPFLQKAESGPSDPVAAAQMQRNLVLATLRDALTVEQVGLSLALSISALSERPAMASTIANTVAEVYLQDQIDVKADATETAADWLTDRVSAQRATLSDLETQLADLQRATATADPAELAEKTTRLRALRTRATEAEAAAMAQESLRDRVQSLMEAGEAAAAYAMLREGRGSGDLATAAPEVVEPIVLAELERISAEASRLRARADTLSTGAERLESEVQAESRVQIRLQQLESEVEASRLVYDTLLTRLKETANQFGALQPDGRIVSRAVTPLFPAEPRRTLIVGIAGVIGGFVGVGIAFLREAMNQKIRSAREVEAATGLSVMAHVPELKRCRNLAQYFKKLRSSPIAIESAQALRTALVLSGVGRAPKKVMVTSSVPGEGKSATCLLLGYAEAAVGKSVIIVDADLRRPKLLRAFNRLEPDAYDLLSTLDGRNDPNDAIVHDEASGIHFIGVTHSMPQASQLVTSNAFGSLIERLSERFDMIVIDSPPVMLVPDAMAMARFVDSTLFAIKWNSTPADVATVAINRLEQYGAAVTGVVLTRTNIRRAIKLDPVQYGSYGSDNPYFSPA